MRQPCGCSGPKASALAKGENISLVRKRNFEGCDFSFPPCPLLMFFSFKAVTDFSFEREEDGSVRPFQGKVVTAEFGIDTIEIASSKGIGFHHKCCLLQGFGFLFRYVFFPRHPKICFLILEREAKEREGERKRETDRDTDDMDYSRPHQHDLRFQICPQTVPGGNFAALCLVTCVGPCVREAPPV